MAAANVIRRGSCLCQAVKFTISGPPLRQIQCNCLNCQKSSGSAFLTNILYKSDQYKLESGSEKVKIYEDRDTDSGAVLERSFCSNCGTNLHIRNPSKSAANVVVCAGSVDDSFKEFKPQSELFAHRRHSWVPAVKRDKPKGPKI